MQPPGKQDELYSSDLSPRGDDWSAIAPAAVPGPPAACNRSRQPGNPTSTAGKQSVDWPGSQKPASGQMRE